MSREFRAACGWEDALFLVRIHEERAGEIASQEGCQSPSDRFEERELCEAIVFLLNGISADASSLRRGAGHT